MFKLGETYRTESGDHITITLNKLNNSDEIAGGTLCLHCHAVKEHVFDLDGHSKCDIIACSHGDLISHIDTNNETYRIGKEK